ncbi:MAG: 6-bladed beta-propeller [Candidatus Aminicenantes bacterium]|nr:MAG: 6-bladed beta-propeller [Candidatus Aminicenantes bacterium]
MKKNIYLIMALCIFFACGPKSERVEKIMEDGVEIVINHLEPYRLKDEPSTLNLEKVLSIDTEDDAVAAQGLTDIYHFDVDARGNIYILRHPIGPGELVFKFSGEGNLMTSFARLGQGPFEVEYPNGILLVDSDRIWILEDPKRKIYVFDLDGKGIVEKRLGIKYSDIALLKSGTYLVMQLKSEDMKAKYWPIIISLYDSEFQKIKELDRFEKYWNRLIATTLQEKIVCGTELKFLGRPKDEQIYIGNSERGYEILVFDLEGQLLRKIRKEYSPVPVSQDYKEKYVKDFESFMPEYAKKIYFPEHWHPFRSFFLDDEGRLYVMTYEPGENPGENMFDIFNKDGVFISRISLDVYHWSWGEMNARAKGDRLYVVQEKESGYKELVVYRMNWE